MYIQAQDVELMTNEIWSGMLQIELRPDATVEPLKGDRVGSCVQITGAWQGAVRVDCSLNLARTAAGRFLGEDPGAVAMDQVRDAMGELANMSAGSVKPLLPTPCQISLPAVADGSDYNFSIPQSEVVLRSAFRYHDDRLLITVLQKRA